MSSAITRKATVQAGGKIEITDTELRAGNIVDVIVLLSANGAIPDHSITDARSDSPGHLAFQTANEVDAYVREERDAWQR